MEKPERMAHLKTAITEKNAELKDLLVKYPQGYPTCCGTETTLERMWGWTLFCRDFAADLETELFGTTDGSNIERTNEEFDEMFEALAPDLNLPVKALEG